MQARPPTRRRGVDRSYILLRRGGRGGGGGREGGRGGGEGDFVGLCRETTEGQGSGGGVKLGGLNGGKAEEEGMLALEAEPVAD